jgi:segregation and condensation protein B
MEAALYAAGRPLSLEELERVSKTGGMPETESLLQELADEYRNRSSSLEIVQVSKGRYTLQLKPEYSIKVSRLSPGGLLSLGSLKTLALVALRQPIRQSEVIEVRGAHSYEHIHRLEQLGFVRKQPSGKSVTLTTTKMFSEYFGFEDDLAKLKVQLHRKLVKLDTENQPDGKSATTNEVETQSEHEARS